MSALVVPIQAVGRCLANLEGLMEPPGKVPTVAQGCRAEVPGMVLAEGQAEIPAEVPVLAQAEFQETVTATVAVMAVDTAAVMAVDTAAVMVVDTAAVTSS